MLWLAYLLIFLYGLAHTPLLVDLLRHFLPHWNIQRLTSHAASVILILLVLFVFLLGLVLQVFIFIPHMPGVPLRSLKLILHCLLAYWLWANVVVNYLYVLFSKPGVFRPSREEREADKSGVVLDPKESGTEEGGGLGVFRPSREEKKVDNSGVILDPKESGTEEGRDLDVSHRSGVDTKPEREQPGKPPSKTNSHYCKVCQASIPYRDHHCPFTGNCISLDNYSYFLLSLFYSMAGLSYGVAVFFTYFGKCFFLAWKAVGVLDKEREEEEMCVVLEPYGEIILPTLGALVTVSLMFGLQVFMLLANISTHDLLRRWRKIERIDLGSFRREGSRFKVMFLHQRTHPIWFLLPVRNKYS